MTPIRRAPSSAPPIITRSRSPTDSPPSTTIQFEAFLDLLVSFRPSSVNLTWEEGYYLRCAAPARPSVRPSGRTHTYYSNQRAMNGERGATNAHATSDGRRRDMMAIVRAEIDRSREREREAQPIFSAQILAQVEVGLFRFRFRSRFRTIF